MASAPPEVANGSLLLLSAEGTELERMAAKRTARRVQFVQVSFRMVLFLRPIKTFFFRAI